VPQLLILTLTQLLALALQKLIWSVITEAVAQALMAIKELDNFEICYESIAKQ
jgi:hypothetical protein